MQTDWRIFVSFSEVGSESFAAALQIYPGECENVEIGLSAQTCSNLENSVQCPLANFNFTNIKP